MQPGILHNWVQYPLPRRSLDIVVGHYSMAISRQHVQNGFGWSSAVQEHLTKAVCLLPLNANILHHRNHGAGPFLSPDIKRPPNHLWHERETKTKIKPPKQKMDKRRKKKIVVAPVWGNGDDLIHSSKKAEIFFKVNFLL